MASKQSYVPTSEELKEAIHGLVQDVAGKLPTSHIDPKSIQTALQANNPNWKLPQRRVSKYIKRELKVLSTGGNPNMIDDDDDNSSVTSNTSTASSVARRMLKPLSLRNVMKKKKEGGSSRFSFRRNKQSSSSKNIPTTVKNLPSEKALPTSIPAPKLLPSLSGEEYAVDDLIEASMPSDERTPVVDDNKNLSLDAVAESTAAAAFDVTARGGLETTKEGVMDAYHDDNDGTQDNQCAECAKCVVM